MSISFVGSCPALRWASHALHAIQGPGNPAFVRRRGKETLSDIHHTQIDWRKTLDLNLLVHSEYTLTVAACAYDALHIHRLQNSSSGGPGLTQVSAIS